MQSDPNDAVCPVLGIALVAEQVGKGADLIFRYPATNSLSSHGASRFDPVSGSNTYLNTKRNVAKDHLFFSLPPRVMAKLFRTKAPLCHQPMTLLVGGETIFCCRSVLLSTNNKCNNTLSTTVTPNDLHNNTTSFGANRQTGESVSPLNAAAAVSPLTFNTSTSSHDSNNTPLVLFSIIVGLLTDPFTSTNRLRDQKSAPTSQSNIDDGTGEISSSNSLTKVTNPAVRHIHMSLYRLCRALEREEYRCAYVSRQVKRMIQIRNFTIRSMKGPAMSLSSSFPAAGHRGLHDDEDTNAQNNNEGHGNSSRDIFTRETTSCLMDCLLPSDNEKSINEQIFLDSAVGDFGVTRSFPAPSLNVSNVPSASIPESSFEPRSIQERVVQKLESGRSSTGRDGRNNRQSVNHPMSLVFIGDTLSQTRLKVLSCESHPSAVRSLSASNNNASIAPGDFKGDSNIEQEQAVLENMLTESQPLTATSSMGRIHNEAVPLVDDADQCTPRQYTIPLFGNLALELAQTFHCLSRNHSDRFTCHYLNVHRNPLGDNNSYGNRSTIFPENIYDGIVYINKHIAVPIEPAILSVVSSIKDEVTPRDSLSPLPITESFIRPYHTLLFPNASPMEILHQFLISHGFSAHPCNVIDNHKRLNACDGSQRLPPYNHTVLKILQSAGDPFTSLQDLSFMTALPLSSILEVAYQLVRSGVCHVVPAFHRSNTAFVLQDTTVASTRTLHSISSGFGGERSTDVGNLRRQEKASYDDGNGCNNDGLKKLRSLSLAFSQRFGPYIPIFIAVCALTTPLDTTYDESAALTSNMGEDHRIETPRYDQHIDIASSSDRSSPSFLDDSKSRRLRNFVKFSHVIRYCSLSYSYLERGDTAFNIQDNPGFFSVGSVMDEKVPSRFQILTERILRTLRSENIPKGFLNFPLSPTSKKGLPHDMIDPIMIEYSLIAMASWLTAHNVIVSLKEYLVPVNVMMMSLKDSSSKQERTNQSEADKISIGAKKGHVVPAEELYNQVIDAGYLTNGNISTTALAWRCGWSSASLQLFRQYILREKKFALVVRTHYAGDDWGSP